jgi:hypothetical protein
LNINPKVSSGGRGTLDVLVDGKTIFSHQGERRMPAPGEIVELISALQGSAPA